MEIRQTTLENGLQIITVERPSEFVSINVRVNSGARDENTTNRGVAHFVEHCIFNATPTRSRQDIDNLLVQRGGMINAGTTMDRTLFFTDTAGEDIETAMDLLGDILQNSLFREEDIAKEKEIIKQEIRNGLDNRGKKFFWNFCQAAYSNEFIKSRCIGTEKDIEKINRKTLLEFVKQFYCANNIYISAAGKIKHDEFVEMVKKYFYKIEKREIPKSESLNYTGGFRQIEEDGNSLLLELGFCSGGKEYNPPALFLRQIMGTHGRLNEEIREKRGLSYSARTDSYSFKDSKVLTLRATSNIDNANKILDIMIDEIHKICNQPVSPEEMEMVRRRILNSERRNWENNQSMAVGTISDLLHAGQILSHKEYIGMYEAVTAEDIMLEARKIFATPLTFSLYGNAPGIYDYGKLIEKI